MTLVYYLRDILACFAASMFYCVIMSLPKKALIASSVTASVSYLIFRFMLVEAEEELIGYVLAALFAAVLSEILARVCKMPATIFIFPAVIPLVPGLGLYRTMLCLIRNDMKGFASEGMNTILISGIIAVTVALVNSFFRSALKKKPREQK